MKAIIPYVSGGTLISSGVVGVGSLVVLYGIFRDWRFWLLTVTSFMIGFHWGR